MLLAGNACSRVTSHYSKSGPKGLACDGVGSVGMDRGGVHGLLRDRCGTVVAKRAVIKRAIYL